MPRVLVVDDDDFHRQVLSDLLKAEDLAVDTASSVADARQLVGENYHLAVVDRTLEDGTGFDIVAAFRDARVATRFIMLTGHATVINAVAALRQGIDDFLTKPFETEELRHAVMRSLKAHQLQRHHDARRGGHRNHHSARMFDSQHRVYQEAITMARRSAEVSQPVLITGETGTGKTMLARYIHERSTRAEEPFVAVNCAALPETLIESELFGAARGAFTGAQSDRKGLVEHADGGVVFLDEIGELSPALQAKLLGVLEDHSFRRLGDHRERSVDVRVIAATHVDLEEAVKRGTFRSDLYFRLDVLRIHLPPLRERPLDIDALAHRFLHSVCSGRTVRLVEGELEALREYAWPGNLRELRNVLERATILQDEQALRPSELLSGAGRRAKPTEAANVDPSELTLEAVERAHLRRVLNQCSGRRAETAQILGISVSTLRRRLKQLALPEANEA